MSSSESQQIAVLTRTITDLEKQLAAKDERQRQSDIRIQELTASVTRLSIQVAELLAQLKSDSTNSSKPPSHDGPAAKKRSLRKPSGRKPGGQPGHPGATLEMVANPDRVEIHRPPSCGKCGIEFDNRLPPVKVERRQVFDLPTELRLEVTEHQLQTLCCSGCGAKSKAAGPVAVTAPTQYGPHCQAFTNYLVVGKYLSCERAADLYQDLFGQPVSTGTVKAMIARAAAVLDSLFKPVAKTALQQEMIAHADETGFKVAGSKMWVHSFSSAKFTWIEAHEKRGPVAMEEIGILPQFGGILVHDAWAPYNKYGSDRQLCCAHVTRELAAVTQQHAHPEGEWCWAIQVSEALSTIIHDPTTITQQTHLILSALAAADSKDPDRPGNLGRKSRSLRKRIHTRMDDYLRFTTIPGLPPTNNPAEQEIRMVKIKQKNAGSMRTKTGANEFLAIRSYISTALKHGVRALQALASLTSTNPWLPVTT